LGSRPKSREDETAEIVSPISRRIPIHSIGWSKSTQGIITAPVVILENATLEEGSLKNKLDGAIVLLTER
jgi:hypothetical protein